MDTIEAIHTRRSIRRYETRPVPRALIEDILFDAAQAPAPPVSGGEPFLFTVIQGAARIAECDRRALLYAREHRPAGAGYDWTMRDDFSVFFGAPVVILISGLRNEHGQALQDCNRAGQNLMLSAHARGLGTCWVGSPMLWMRDAATRAEFAIPDGYDPVAVFTLGYPADAPTGTPRPRPTIQWR